MRCLLVLLICDSVAYHIKISQQLVLDSSVLPAPTICVQNGGNYNCDEQAQLGKMTKLDFQSSDNFRIQSIWIGSISGDKRIQLVDDGCAILSNDFVGADGRSFFWETFKFRDSDQVFFLIKFAMCDPNDPVYCNGSTNCEANEGNKFLFDKMMLMKKFTPFETNARNAFEAELRCRKQGGHLAFFRTRSELDQYLSINDHPSVAWIGVQLISDIDSFRNVDGTEPYLEWLDGEPEACGDGSGYGPETCVGLTITSTGVTMMDVVDCSTRHPYSCRIDSTPECAETGNCLAADVCERGYGNYFCPVTCGICDTWVPQEIGDISFLDNWNSTNCVDLNDDCYFWAGTDECMINPNYMLENCPASCYLC